MTSRRPITSCLECYRRKQKCNRRQPCDQCTSRNVPERCRFGHSGSNNNDINHSSSSNANTRARSRLAVTSRAGLDVRLSGGQQQRQLRAGWAGVEDEGLDDEEDTSPSSGLISQAGYSPSTGSNTYVRLRSRNLSDMTPSTSPSTDETPPASSVASGQEHSDARDRRRNETYRTIVGKMPSKEVMDMLLDYCFAEMHWINLGLDEHYFRNLYREWMSPHQQNLTNTPLATPSSSSHTNHARELAYFPALLFQLLGHILRNIPTTHPSARLLHLSTTRDCDALSATYHRRGNALISALGGRQRRPALCGVEHDIVSVVWLKDSSKGAEAWSRLSDAVRQAQELGLHRLPQTFEQTEGDTLESNLLQAWELEHKKRIWARLLILDSLMAYTLGRPRLINLEDTSTTAPLNVAYPRDPARTLPLASEANPSHDLILFLSLAHKVHRMLSLQGKGVLARDYTKVMEVHEDISSLRHEMAMLPLPNTTTAAASSATISSANNIVAAHTTGGSNSTRTAIWRLSILNTISSILLTLHRPLIPHHPTSRIAAVTSALEGLDIQDSISSLVPASQARFYSGIFSTIDVCIFLCGVLVELPPSSDPADDRRVRQAVVRGINRLSELKELSSLAASGEKVLQRFLEEVDAARGQTVGGSLSGGGEPISSVVNTESTGDAQGDVLMRNFPVPPLQQTFEQTFQQLFGGTSEFMVSDYEMQPLDWNTEDVPWDIRDPYYDDIF